MPEIPPPPTAAAGSGTAGGATGAAAPGPALQPVGEVALERLPPRLAGLDRPVVLTGTPTGTTEDGTIRLRTRMGEVLLRTRAALPPDRQVTLHVPAGTPPGSPPTRALAFVTLPAQPPPAGLPPDGLPPPTVKAANPAASGAVPPLMGPPLIGRSGTPSGPGGTPPAVGTTIPATVVATAPLRPALPAPAVPARPAPHQAATAAAAYGTANPATSPAGTAPLAATPFAAGSPSGAAPHRTAPVPVVPTAPGVPAAPQGSGPHMPVPQPSARDGSTVPRPAPSAPPPPSLTGGIPTAGPRPDGGDASAQRAAAPRASLPPASAPLPAPLPVSSSRPSPVPGATPAADKVADTLARTAASTPSAAPTPAQPPPPRPDALSGLRQGMPVELHVLRAPPLPGEPAASLPPAATGRISATVTDSMPAGQTVLSTASGTVVVQARAVLPAGTLVALGLPAASAPPFAPFQQTDWPNLRRAIDALSAADPGGARMLLARVLPQAGPHLAAALAHFTTMVRHGGDTRRWLGDRAAQVLEAVDGGRALSGLDEDLRTLGRQAAEPLQGDWRAYSLPFADGHAVTRIQLFVRNAGEEEKDGEGRAHGRGATRFVIDAELSRIGPLQLDGLMRDRRFDLVLRTHEPLPADMRQDILRLFAVTVEALGLSGAVSFQGSGQGWLTLAPIPAAAGRGVVA